MNKAILFNVAHLRGHILQCGPNIEGPHRSREFASEVPSYFSPKRNFTSTDMSFFDQVSENLGPVSFSPTDQLLQECILTCVLMKTNSSVFWCCKVNTCIDISTSVLSSFLQNLADLPKGKLSKSFKSN